MLDILINGNTWILMFAYRNISLSSFLIHVLQQGLCIARATAPVINVTIILIMLPVCRTFNKFIHKVFSKISSHLLALYLEKLKVIHQCLAVTLVFTCGRCVVRNSDTKLYYWFYAISVIHSVAHFVNAINYVQNYDSKFPEINWARDEDDVRLVT